METSYVSALMIVVASVVFLVAAWLWPRPQKSINIPGIRRIFPELRKTNDELDRMIETQGLPPKLFCGEPTYEVSISQQMKRDEAISQIQKDEDVKFLKAVNDYLSCLERNSTTKIDKPPKLHGVPSFVNYTPHASKVPAYASFYCYSDLDFVPIGWKQIYVTST